MVSVSIDDQVRAVTRELHDVLTLLEQEKRKNEALRAENTRLRAEIARHEQPIVMNGDNTDLILRLYRSGYSIRRISQQVYGYHGGAAYRRVKAVLCGTN